MEKHTAETLRFYLNKKNPMPFWIEAFKQVINLRGVDVFYNDIKILNSDRMKPIVVKDSNPTAIYCTFRMDLGYTVYPVLKTEKELTDDEKLKVYGPISTDSSFMLVGFDPQYRNATGSKIYNCSISNILSLLFLGAGAEKNRNSPTGYVDIMLNLPCVTPEMVKNGFKL